jgi:RND superfamily putative drug exporter
LSDKLGNTVASYWSLGNAPPLASKDHTQALVLGVITGSDDHVDDVIKTLSPEFTRDNATVSVAVGGRAEVFRQVGETIKSDLSRAESIALPITLILLVIVFGSLIGPPLLNVLSASSRSRPVPRAVRRGVGHRRRYSPTLTTALVRAATTTASSSSRSEELHNGLEPNDAVVRTVALRPHGGGQRADGRGVAHRVVAVPARASARSVRRHRGRCSPHSARSSLPRCRGARHQGELGAHLPHREPKPVGEGVWHRAATTVMRRPIPIATAVILLLLVLDPLPAAGDRL